MRMRCDKLHMSCDKLHMGCDKLHMGCDKLHMGCDKWHTSRLILQAGSYSICCRYTNSASLHAACT